MLRFPHKLRRGAKVLGAPPPVGVAPGGLGHHRQNLNASHSSDLLLEEVDIGRNVTLSDFQYLTIYPKRLPNAGRGDIREAVSHLEDPLALNLRTKRLGIPVLFTDPHRLESVRAAGHVERQPTLQVHDSEVDLVNFLPALLDQLFFFLNDLSTLPRKPRRVRRILSTASARTGQFVRVIAERIDCSFAGDNTAFRLYALALKVA